ncbi:hypothetical protein AB0G04_41790 [Actinoplanes sp. NPDC023801]|uniref:hypothetical protein n=1 Tax=Actinoplanes sp. NPDC023801 TaxID=3154595 RepID=UPI0033E1D8AE
MEGPDQLGGAADTGVGERERRVVGSGRHLALDEGQDLPALLVVAERPRRPGEAGFRQMTQKLVDVAGTVMHRPAHGVAHPYRRAHEHR